MTRRADELDARHKARRVALCIRGLLDYCRGR